MKNGKPFMTMKTTKILFAAIAMVALAVSCNKEAGTADSFTEGTELTIRATQETGSRTMLVDGGDEIYWEPYETIKVFFKNSSGVFTSTNTELAEVADFTGTLTAIVGSNEGAMSSNKIWGLYPYRPDAVYDGHSVTTLLPSTQAGRAGSFAKNTHITLACSDGLDLAFYNVCGGVRFSLKQEGIQKVTFEGNKGEGIAGTVRLNFASGYPNVLELKDPLTSITLRASDGSPFQTGVWYYIEALPCELSEGYKMTFHKSDAVATLTSTEAVSIKRGAFGSKENADDGLEFIPIVVPVDGINLNKYQLELEEGQDFELVATVKPDNATDKTVKWSSSNEEVASVVEGKVTALKEGEALITAKAGEKSAQCKVIVKAKETPSTSIQPLDMGLSVKWANMNLGASSPEEYGDYYAWGEIEPHYLEGYSQLSPCNQWRTGKVGYNWTVYKWGDYGNRALSKYNTDSLWGTVDDKTSLDPEDDAAHVILKGSWRMPTRDECLELLETETNANYKWEWTTVNDVRVYSITYLVNGNCLILPLTGYREDLYLKNSGNTGTGEFWTSNMHKDYSSVLEPFVPYAASILKVSWGDARPARTLNNSRRCGLPIRAVTE